ncbi:MAG: hypothetical protein ACI8RA_000239 [Chlamydiales bacterium]|jgi:hypothetical protein
MEEEPILAGLSKKINGKYNFCGEIIFADIQFEPLISRMVTFQPLQHHLQEPVCYACAFFRKGVHERSFRFPGVL